MAQFKINTNFWVGMIFMVIAMIALFWIAQGIFTILSWVAPILFIITLIIRYQVVLQFGRTLINLVRRNPFMGIAAIILSIIGFPLVVFYLFGRALLDRKVEKMSDEYQKHVGGEYADYEIIDEEPLELPEMEERSSSNDYDEYFKND